MGAVMLLGLGLALIMALGGGGKSTEPMPLPKKKEEDGDVAELDITPYHYALTAEPAGEGDPGVPETPGEYPGEGISPGVPGVPSPGESISIDMPGTSADALNDARQAGLAEAAAAREAAAAAAAEERAAREIEAARQAGAAEAAAAHAAAEEAHAQAAAAQEQIAAANAAAQAQHETLLAAQADAENARAQGDMAQAAAAERAAAEAQAREEAANQAAELAERERQLAEDRAAEKEAQEQRAAAEAGQRAAEAARIAEEAKQQKLAAEQKKAEENANKQKAAAEAEAKARAEAIQKANEAKARAADAKRKQQEAIATQNREKAIAAQKQQQLAIQAANQAKQKQQTANEITLSRDLEQKRVVVKDIFDEAVNRRQAATSSMPILSREAKTTQEKPKPKATISPDAQKVALIKKYRDAVVNFAKTAFKTLRKQELPVAIRNKIDGEFVRIMLMPAAGTGMQARMSEQQLMAMPMPMLDARLRQATVAAEQTADVEILKGSPKAAEAYNNKWKGKDPYKASVVLRNIKPVVAGIISGYAFVGAVGQRNETRQESLNVVASHFKKKGVDLGKPDPRKAFWKQPVTKIQQMALSAANTIPLPKAAKTPPVLKQRPLPAVTPVVAKQTSPTTAVVVPATTAPTNLKAAIQELQIAILQAAPAVPDAKRRAALDKHLRSQQGGRPDTARFTDGVLGPATLTALNLALGAKFTAAYVKANVAKLTATLKQMAARGPAATRAQAPAAAKPAPTSNLPAITETNRKTIANTFTALVTKRKKAFPKEAQQNAVNKVAAYLKKTGVPLDKPNLAAPHPMHKGEPKAVAAKLAQIANAYKPTQMAGWGELPRGMRARPRPRRIPMRGVGPYFDFYGSRPTSSGIDLISLGGWNS